jgi:hypothetical protein
MVASRPPPALSEPAQHPGAQGSSTGVSEGAPPKPPGMPATPAEAPPVGTGAPPMASAAEPLARLPPELGESAPPEPPNSLGLTPPMALAPLPPPSPEAPTAAAPAELGENQSVVELEQARLAVQKSAIRETEDGKHFMRPGRKRSPLKRGRYLKRPNHLGIKMRINRWRTPIVAWTHIA